MFKPESKSSVRSASAIVIFCLVPILLHGQEVRCDLTKVSAESISGTCNGIIPPVLRLTKSSASTDVLWEGSATEGDLVWPLDIAAVQNAEGEVLIVRYEMGWYYIDEFDPVAPAPILVWNMNREVTPSAIDIDILDLALAKLDNGYNWDRVDNRVCGKNPELFSIYCALVSATTEKMGKPYHRQPALQAIRNVIGERWPERFSNHRLMDFNNNQATDFDDVVGVFDAAKDSLISAVR